MVEPRSRLSRPVSLVLVGATFSLLLFTAFALRSTPSQTGIIINHGTALDSDTENDLPEAKCSCNCSEKEDVKPQVPFTIPHSESAVGNETWQFDPARDGRAYGLTSQHCNAAFPGLFTEIERAKMYQKSKWRITPQDLNISWKKDGALRVAIIDQQLYILEAKILSDYSSVKAIGLLHSIHRAVITSPMPVPDIEFSFITTDIADPDHLLKPIWALSRTSSEPEKWLLSDFGFWSWPLDLVGAYEQIRREISATEVEFEAKKKQVVWRGAVKTNAFRKDLIRVTKGKEWADVKGIQWKSSTKLKGQDKARAISTPEQCQYQFLIQTEGHSYSGRGKYLQNCNSVVVIPKRNWIEPHHSLLVSEGPQQNFVEVEEDFSDLEEKISYLLANPELAKQIAANGVTTFRDRVLTSAAQNCYWRELMTAWAEISFEPKKWDIVSGSERRTRGVPFETFVVQSIMPASCSLWQKMFFQC